MKKKTEHNILFDSSGCLSQEAITLFIKGELSDKEIRLVKKHSSVCELCTDALEGAAHFKSARSYNTRIEQMHNSTWRRSQSGSTKTKRLYYGLSSAAASLIILLGIFFILRMDKLIKEEIDVLGEPEIALTVAEEDSLVSDEAVLSLKENETEAARVQKSKPIRKKEEIKPKKAEETQMIVLDERMSDVESFELEEESIEPEREVFKEKLAKQEFSATQEIAPNSVVVSAPIAKSSEEITPENVSSRTEKRKGAFRRSREDAAMSKEDKSDLAISSDSYYMAEIMPMFQGGDLSTFNKYIADSLIHIIPDSVYVESILVSFTVDKMGRVKKVKLVSGSSSDALNRTIIGIVKSSPNWIPGSVEGKAVEIEQRANIVLDTINKSY